MKRFYLVLLLIAGLLGMSNVATAIESGQLQATHVGYYNDGNFTWQIYFNDNEYYAKCYLGASTVTAPTWTTAVTTIQATVNGENYALPTVFVFEDAPSTASTYTYSKTANGKTEAHNLSYTVESAGAMATVYNIYANSGTDLSAYNTTNPLVLTVPDEVTLTVGSPNSSKTDDVISNVKITRLGSTQWSDNYFWHIGDALNTLGVPVKLVLGSNIQVIMANAFRVNNSNNENDLKGCTNLYGLDFNGNTNLWYIGSNAFKGATNLKLYPISASDDHAVAVPTSLTQLQDSAFANSGIRSLVVNHAIQNLGNNVFENCDNMEYVTFRYLAIGSENMMLSRDIENFKEELAKNSIDTTTTSVKAQYQRLIQSIPTHVLVYAPNKFNKSYTYLDKSVGGYNIITTGDVVNSDSIPHCYHFYVYDNTSVTGNNNAKGSYDYWVPIAFDADSCDYNRSFPTGWVTSYLPFDWKLPDGCKAYQASDDLLSTNSEGETVFSFTEVSGTAMKANTPYLLYNSNSSNVTIAQVVTASPGLTIPKSVHPSANTYLSSDAATKALFWGTTEDIPNDSASTYYKGYNVRSDQTWGKISSSATAGYIGRFRSFVSDTRTTTASAKPYIVEMIINTPSGTTSISTIDANSLLHGNTRIYSIDGRYVGTDFTNLPNGIYIRNGKKFRVKNQ